MKSLKVIQVLAKIGKIISKIGFIFCIIGFCGCAVGIAALAVGLGTFKIGGLSLYGLIEDKAGMSPAILFASMGVGLIYCAAEAVLCKFSENYFKHELEDGTPFTHRGAKELLRLGILTIAIPTCLSLVSAIGVGIANNFDPTIKDLSVGSFGSVGLGIMMIFTSLICRYGADLRGGQTEEFPTIE